MKRVKSDLNPHAAPYIPRSKLFSGTIYKSAEMAISPGKYKATKKPLEYQLPNSLNYDTKDFERLNLSSELASKIGQHNYSDNTFQDESSGWDASYVKLDPLSSMFPDISVEYLAAILAANQGDLRETIDVLQEFKYEGDGSDYYIEAAKTSNSCNLTSLQASCTIEGAETGNRFDLASQKTGNNYSDNAFQDKSSGWDASYVKLDPLSSMFPDISVEYLAAILAANQGDLRETIDVLQEFKYEGDGSEYYIEAAKTSNSCDLTSLQASCTIEGAETGNRFDLASQKTRSSK
ncbi:unnamed protein product [Musa acuminata subsp. burmannicoides]